MQRLSLISVVWVLGCASGSATNGPEAPSSETPEPQGDDESAQQEFFPLHEDTTSRALVKTTFVPSVSEIAPGASFKLAVRFEIPSGYRLGWSYPGDVGKATTVRFSVPPGFELGPTMLPGPSRYSLSGGLLSYGYKDELVAFAEVRAPSTLATDGVHRFQVQASWLACERECIDEGTDAYFELTVNPNADAESFDAPLTQHLQAVPRALATLEGAKYEWQNRTTLLVSATGVTWKEFFPATAKLAPASVSPQGERLLIRFSGPANAAGAVGVASAQLDGQPIFVELRSP